MRRHQLQPGTEVRVNGNDYMRVRVRRILPHGSHGKKCVLVECECTSEGGDWSFGLVKTFRMVDLRPTPNTVHADKA